MDKLPTIAEFWKLSTADRKKLYEEEGIGSTFLRDYWSAYEMGREVNVTALQGLRDTAGRG